MAVKISAQKFLEGLISLGLGVKQGQQHGQQIALQRQDQEQQRLLSLLPQLARMEEQRLAALTEPLERAIGDPNLDPASRAQVYQQLQRMYQEQWPSPAAGLYGKAIGGQLSPQDLQGFGQGGGGAAPDLSALKFRDPRAERQADELLQEKRMLLRNTAGQRQNPAAYAPFIAAGELPAAAPVNSAFPVLGGRGAMAPVNILGGGEFVPAGAGERIDEVNARQALRQEQERQKGQSERDNRLDARAEETRKARLQLETLKIGARAATDKVKFQAQAREAANKVGFTPEQAEYYYEQAGADFDEAHGKAAAAPVGPAPKLAGPTAVQAGIQQKQAGIKLTEARTGDISDNAKDRRARADAYTRKVAADLDPNVVGGQAWMRKNTMEARQNTEARLARQAAGGGGVQKWNPGLTARVDSAENAVKNAETVLAQTISAFQKEEADAAKAAGVPSKHNYVVLDLDKLDKDLAAGRIKPTMKVGGKDVPNPQYDKFVRLNNLYRGVKVQRQELNKTLDKLAPVNAVTIKPGTGSQPLKTGLPDVNERVRKPSTPLSDVERKAIKMLQGSTNPNAGRPFTYAEAERLIRAQR